MKASSWCGSDWQSGPGQRATAVGHTMIKASHSVACHSVQRGTSVTAFYAFYAFYVLGPSGYAHDGPAPYGMSGHAVTTAAGASASRGRRPSDGLFPGGRPLVTKSRQVSKNSFCDWTAGIDSVSSVDFETPRADFKFGK